MLPKAYSQLKMCGTCTRWSLAGRSRSPERGLCTYTCSWAQITSSPALLSELLLQFCYAFCTLMKHNPSEIISQSKSLLPKLLCQTFCHCDRKGTTISSANALLDNRANVWGQQVPVVFQGERAPCSSKHIYPWSRNMNLTGWVPSDPPVLRPWWGTSLRPSGCSLRPPSGGSSGPLSKCQYWHPPSKTEIA